MSEEDKCDCGNELAKHEVPNDKFLFAAFGYEFVIRKWEYVHFDMCIDCLSEQHQRPYKEAYSQGQQDGYTEGMKDMRY